MLALRSRNRQTGAEGCRDGATIVQHYARSANPPPSALPRQRPPSTLSVLLVLSLIALIAAGAAASAASLGANKFDLMLDYVAPSPPAGANPEGYRRVRRAMARKAIADARDAGLAFFRVAVTGYSPSEFNAKQHDLTLWQSDPPRFWASLDAMFDDLDAAGIRLVPSFVWNITQFPALGNDTVATFVRDPNAASRRLLAQFIRDFTSRYKERQTILFYEMGNEMNLLADLDERKRNCRREPCVWGNFTTADMNEFARDTVGLIKSSDPSRPVTSGYSLPRPGAMHLERRSEFAAGGPDWTPDTAAEFDRYLVATNEPFDVISIHVYPDDQTRPSVQALGEHFDPVTQAAKTARSAGKPLFIGEFGDPGGATPFMAHLMDDIVRDRVDYAAIWVWEFYQTSTYETRNTPPTVFDVEPGYTDDVIGMLLQTEKRLGNDLAPSKASAPRVVLTWPLPCADIERQVDLAAVASDGAKAVKQVDFLIDGQPLVTVAAPPYRVPFDPVGRGPRSAEIEARAIAASGATAAFSSNVRLNGDKSRCQPTD